MAGMVVVIAALSAGVPIFHHTFPRLTSNLKPALVFIHKHRLYAAFCN